MPSRHRLALVLLVLAACGAPAATTTTPIAVAPDATHAVRALADAYHAERLALDPFAATEAGDDRYDDRLPDGISPASRAAWRALHERTRSRLQAIPRAALAGEDALTWDVIDDLTSDGLDGVTFDDHLMPLDHLNSVPVQLPVLGSGVGVHPFKRVADYEHFVARMVAFDGWVDTALVNLKEGLATGVTRPRVVVERLLPQLEAVAGKKPEETAFWGAVSLMPTSFSEVDRQRLTEAFRSTLAGKLIPAYARLLAFVRDTYLPGCRTSTATEALPDGKARYAFHVRSSTTSPLDAHQIHLLGAREVERIFGEIDQLRVQEGFTGSRAEFLQAMRRDTRGMVRTGDELLAAYRAMKQRVQPQLAALFGRLPRADFDVRLVEPFREASAPNQYIAASPDGSRPGVFYANAAALKLQPARPSESLFLHEAIPGHHFQVTLARENEALPALRRNAGYNAYIEGWALYVESLGAQLGFYRDAPNRVIALASELFRAMRLVIDTGLHHEGWSRKQAVDYLVATGYPAPLVEAEVDRYIAWPGQALGYKIGELTIRRLRASAERRLGPRFELRAFHDAVLESGALPLALLERKINAWAEAAAAR